MIKLVALDFDGVMTDGTVTVGPDGQESVTCSRLDGLGIRLVQESGVKVVVISAESAGVYGAAQERCSKLGIDGAFGVVDKLAVLKTYAAKYSLVPEEVVYMGDDIGDLQCLDWAGHKWIPAMTMSWGQRPDGCRESAYRGGHGAVRELCEWVMAYNAKELEYSGSRGW